jgi:uncharacterized membrane protein
MMQVGKILINGVVSVLAFGGSLFISKQAEAQSQLIPQGVFQLSGRPAVYYSNGQDRYCWYNSWSELVRLTGSSRPQINQYSISQQWVVDALRRMRYDGICTGGQSIPSAHPDREIAQLPPLTIPPPGFQACNRSSTKIDVAYVTKTSRQSSFGFNTITESFGWWGLASGECRVIYPNDASNVAGIYAQGGGRIWSSNDLPQFCIHPTNRFTFGNEANNSHATCRDQGGSSVGFINVRSSQSSRTFTFGN